MDFVGPELEDSVGSLKLVGNGDTKGEPVCPAWKEL
jgi:hypothetical protein